MNQSTLDTLTQRLDWLERKNRWWKVLGSSAIAALGLVALLGATGAKVADEVRAKRFVLVDDEGNIRAELAVDKERTLLYLKALKGMASLDVGGHKIQGREVAGGASLTLTYRPKGLSSKARQLTAELLQRPEPKSLEEIQESSRRLAAGDYSVSLGVRARGRVLIVSNLLFEDNGKARAQLYSASKSGVMRTSDRGSSLLLYDKNENVIWAVP